MGAFFPREEGWVHSFPERKGDFILFDTLIPVFIKVPWNPLIYSGSLINLNSYEGLLGLEDVKVPAPEHVLAALLRSTFKGEMVEG